MSERAPLMRSELTRAGASWSAILAAGMDGETSAKTLVAIHGAGHSSDAFRALFESSALRPFDRIAVDLPGRHGSPTHAASSVAEAAIAVEGLLHGLALGGESSPIVLVGHSYGGAVAIELALRGVVTIESLVLVSTGARLRVLPSNLALFEEVAAGRAARPRGLGFSDAAARDLVERFESLFDDVPAATALADWRAADRFDRLADASAIGARTLVVCGDADPFTPLRYAEFLASKLPDATLATVRGGSHLALIERADEVASAIARFVSAR